MKLFLVLFLILICGILFFQIKHQQHNQQKIINEQYIKQLKSFESKRGINFFSIEDELHVDQNLYNRRYYLPSKDGRGFIDL